jgi:beta-lactam-binding protein with PASTA domain
MAADDKQESWWQTVPSVIKGLVALLGALTGLIIAVNQWRGCAPTTATLPSVTGVRLKDAEELLRGLGFTHVGSRRKSSTAVPGTVIEQFPNPGTTVRLDQHVILMVAAPPPSSPPLP